MVIGMEEHLGIVQWFSITEKHISGEIWVGVGEESEGQGWGGRDGKGNKNLEDADTA